MDLCDDDERHREVIQLTELAVEVGSSLRRLKALGFATIREGTVCGRQVRIDVRLE